MLSFDVPAHSLDYFQEKWSETFPWEHTACYIGAKFSDIQGHRSSIDEVLYNPNGRHYRYTGTTTHGSGAVLAFIRIWKCMHDVTRSVNFSGAGAISFSAPKIFLSSLFPSIPAFLVSPFPRHVLCLYVKACHLPSWIARTGCVVTELSPICCIVRDQQFHISALLISIHWNSWYCEGLTQNCDSSPIIIVPIMLCGWWELFSDACFTPDLPLCEGASVLSLSYEMGRLTCKRNGFHFFA